MARPKKTRLDRFPLDVDFFSDEKIVAIAHEFGIKGELTAIKLLCAVYRNGYFAVWNDAFKIALCQSLQSVSAQLLEQIVARLVHWGFFDRHMFEQCRILTSRAIQRRYCEAVSRRSLDTSGLRYWLQDEPETDPEASDSRQCDDTTQNTAPDDTIAEMVADIRKSEIWLEQTQMLFHVDKDTLSLLLEEFITHCRAYEKTHASLGECKRHFLDWARIRLETNKNGNNGNNASTALANRTHRKAAAPKPKCGLIED